MAVNTPALEKIALILAKAERTDNKHEREMFFEAAQKMASRAEVDLDVIRYSTKKKEERHKPEQRHIEIGGAGDRGAGTYTDLFLAIATVNDVECIAANAWVDAYGMPSDIDYTETLYAVIVQQMIKERIEYIESEEWRDDGVSIGDARKSFCHGYRLEIKARLGHARREALDKAKVDYAAQGISTAVVMADKNRQVRELYWKDARGMGWRKQSYGNSTSARSAGGAAARRARINNNGQISARQSISG